MELVQRPVFHPSGAGKSDNEVKVKHVNSDIESDSQPGLAGSARSTYDDIRGMQRMGKQQQLDRNFRQLSLTAFVSLATASWEIGLFIISPALIDGGRAGLVWSSLWCWIGFAPIYLSMVRILLECLPSHDMLDVHHIHNCTSRELTATLLSRLRWPAWLQSPVHNIVSQFRSCLSPLYTRAGPDVCWLDWVSEFAPDKYQKFLSYLTGYERSPYLKKDF